MSSTYSPILRTELIGAGDQAGSWGATTNSNFQYVFESAIAGYVAVIVSPTSNNQVLTYVNGPSASAALDQSIYSMLKLNAGTLGAAFNIFAPPVSKTYIVWNNTAYTATFYNSTVIGNTTPAGSGAVIPAGAKVFIWSDGTSFYGNDSAVGNFSIAGNLSVAGTAAITGAATFTSSIAAQSASFTLPLPITSGGVGTTSFTGTGSNVFSISPALTGTPTAPTAAAGTNTTQIATTAFVLVNGVPSGGIIMWSGSVASIPSGWYLCDGTNTTPDLRDRFIVGAGSSYAVAATGGSKDATLVSHTHSITDPQHSHPIKSRQMGGSPVTPATYLMGDNDAGSLANWGAVTDPASTGISINSTGSSATNANLPPYYALAYIMKA